MSELDQITEILIQPGGDEPEAELDTTEQETASSEVEENPSNESPTEDTVSEDESPSEQPESLKVLAEKSGVDMKTIYGMQVPGTDMTLGELKDSAKQIGDMTTKAVELDERASTIEKQTLQARMELQAVAASIPQQYLSEANLAAAREQMEKHKEQQAAIYADVIPDWSNPETKAADMKIIKDYASEYGLNAERVEQIVAFDAVTGMMWRDAAKARARVKDALDTKVRPLTKQAPKGNRRVSADKTSQIIKQAKAGKVSETDAVTALLMQGT